MHHTLIFCTFGILHCLVFKFYYPCIRFSHVITAQFCGHSHADELHYFYDVKNLLQPINIIYNGGSFATYIDFNPNYKIYDVNPKSMVGINFLQYIFFFYSSLRTLTQFKFTKEKYHGCFEKI